LGGVVRNVPGLRTDGWKGSLWAFRSRKSRTTAPRAVAEQ